MNRKSYKLIAVAFGIVFGLLTSANWYAVAERSPGILSWMLILTGPIVFPALVAVVFERFFPTDKAD